MSKNNLSNLDLDLVKMRMKKAAQTGTDIFLKLSYETQEEVEKIKKALKKISNTPNYLQNSKYFEAESDCSNLQNSKGIKKIRNEVIQQPFYWCFLKYEVEIKLDNETYYISFHESQNPESKLLLSVNDSKLILLNDYDKFLKNYEIINLAREIGYNCFKKYENPIITEYYRESLAYMNGLKLSSNKSKLSNSSQNKEGCYIATAVYGDYNAPEVLILRKFRDETLNKSKIGKIFIKMYYRYSPKIAEKIRKKIKINFFVKLILDKFVNILDRK